MLLEPRAKACPNPVLLISSSSAGGAETALSRHTHTERIIILIFIEMVKKTLLETIAIGEKGQAQLQIQQDKWEFLAKEQGEGARGWKTTKRGHQGPGIPAKPT